MKHPYSLSELCIEIADVLAEAMLPTYWVRAEISSISDRTHCYMELVEKAETGMLSAKVRATCWQSTWRVLAARFLQETGQRLTAGMQVLLEVEVSMHPVYGLSLNVVDIDPAFTLGDLARKRQETIARLDAEGLIGLQQGLILPTLIRRVAVISSDVAAGYQDFVDQLHGAGFAITTALYPAVMQGETAAASILSALEAVASVAEEYDAVAVIRGGGSTTDLGCFDDYLLCRAAALFPLPILSGVGHTRDVSVLDLVCHSALKTPTAVAAFLNDRMTMQSQRIAELRRRLSATVQRQIMIRRHRIELLSERIRMCSPERIYRQGYSLLRSGGKVVRTTGDVHPGDELITSLLDGEITSVAK